MEGQRRGRDAQLDPLWPQCAESDLIPCTHVVVGARVARRLGVRAVLQQVCEAAPRGSAHRRHRAERGRGGAHGARSTVRHQGVDVTRCRTRAAPRCDQRAPPLPPPRPSTCHAAPVRQTRPLGGERALLCGAVGRGGVRRRDGICRRSSAPPRNSPRSPPRFPATQGPRTARSRLLMSSTPTRPTAAAVFARKQPSRRAARGKGELGKW